MTNAIIAELSSDTIASALGFTIRSPSPVLTLCRKLVAESTYAPETPLNAYRGDTLCLKVRSISEGARLEIDGKGVGFRPGRKMSFEIERKFLVLSDAWRNSAIRHTRIRQAYLDSNAKVSIRVRIKDESSAILTLQSRSSKLRRREFEYAIPTLDAEELILLRRSYIIEKVRHIVHYGNPNWEVDVFSGENQGLVVAEIELPDESHQIELPSWIGPEVTGQDRYYNGTLAQHPYRSWLHHDAAVAAE